MHTFFADTTKILGDLMYSRNDCLPAWLPASIARADDQQEAIRRIRSTGANVRTQAPLINHVNADPATWAHMWRLQTRLGAIPYYMFVERDTGARRYFEVRISVMWGDMVCLLLEHMHTIYRAPVAVSCSPALRMIRAFFYFCCTHFLSRLSSAPSR